MSLRLFILNEVEVSFFGFRFCFVALERSGIFIKQEITSEHQKHSRNVTKGKHQTKSKKRNRIRHGNKLLGFYHANLFVRSKISAKREKTSEHQKYPRTEKKKTTSKEQQNKTTQI